MQNELFFFPADQIGTAFGDASLLRGEHEVVHVVEGATQATVGQNAAQTGDSEGEQKQKNENRDCDFDQSESLVSPHAEIYRSNDESQDAHRSRTVIVPRLRNMSGLAKHKSFFLLFAALSVVAILIWQGVTAHGTPDPLRPQTNPSVAILDIAVLVFREGLECILVLAALTASMVGGNRIHRRPVAAGAFIAFGATILTWFIALGIVSQLTESVPALDLQAATGLLAIVVLLVIMNWFFHKIYWGGWIRVHNRRRKNLLAHAGARRLWWGFVLLGFTSLYREGFEVVLFLQSYYLRLGGGVVLQGALLGLTLSAFVAILTFALQERLPYRKMLVTTGVLLGVVLLVMVGEQGQEMQLASWISTTTIPWLEDVMPGWLGLWFAIFPTAETLSLQGLAALLVIGSYFAARILRGAPPGSEATLSSLESKPA